ncbi:M48 family metallopeptidase [Neobacillus niacini]|uniref:M48 family metallopeptidase n=1 Tax=Neobacillus niacini TaxID=86668 RepID=UPI002FFE0233
MEAKTAFPIGLPHSNTGIEEMMMIEQDLFLHPFESAAREEMLKTLNFKNQIEEQYIHFEEKKRRPDLLGKTVKVSELQVPRVYRIAHRICQQFNMDLPSIFVYEDFYYAIDSKGMENPWIELSASLITDFTDKELEFLLAREIGKIHFHYTYFNTLLCEALEMLAKGAVPFSNGIVEDVAKVIFYRWSRLINYSVDCFGYLVCQDLHAASQAILKCVLNSVFLAENTNMREFINQAKGINELHDPVYEAAKSDEQFPYAPFRIKNILAYASSERAMMARKLLI